MVEQPWPSQLYLDGTELVADGRAGDALDLLQLALNTCIEAREMHRIAQCLRWIGIAQSEIGHRESSIATLHHALDVLTQADDPELAADCSGLLGDVYEQIGRFDDAVEAFRRAAFGFFANGNLSESADCHERAGLCLIEMEDADSARAEFVTARVLYVEAGDPLDIARCQYFIGLTSTVQMLADAEIELRSAIEYFALTEHSDAEGDCWEQLGDLYFDAGHIADAVSSYSAAIPLHTNTGRTSSSAHCYKQLGLLQLHLRSPLDAIRSLSSARKLLADEHPDETTGIDLALGMTYEDLGRYADAISAYNRARQVYTELGDTIGVATCTMHLGTVRMTSGDLTNAENLLVKALPEFDASEQPVLRATCLRYLSTLSREKFEFAAAERLLNRSLELLADLDELELESDCRQDLALLLMQNAEYESAIDGLEHARTTYDGLGCVEKSALCLQSIGACLLSLGRYDDAEQTLFESRKVFSDIGIKYGIATSDSHVSQVYLETGRLTEAELAFSRARATFTELGLVDRVAMVDQNIGGLYIAKKDFNAAEEAFMRAATLFDGLGQHGRAAVCRCNIGVAAFLKSDFGRAKKLLTEALEDFGSDLAYRRNVGWCERNLACAEIMDGNHDQALVHLGSARKRFEDLKTMIDVAKCDFLAAMSANQTSGGERLREALELALPAVRYIDAQRFQFTLASTRLAWEITIAQWMAEIFRWADQLGDQSLMSELIESTINSGTHVAAVSAHPLTALVDVESTSISTGRVDGAADSSMGGAGLLVAGAVLPILPPPLLRMPNGRIALQRYLHSTTKRYGGIAASAVVTVA